MTLDDARKLRRDGAHEAARNVLVALAAAQPDDARVQYETACVHDFLGLEQTAVPYYEAALRLGLPDDLLRGAYTGLGSTFRTLGEYEGARRVLEAGLQRFPQDAALRAFLAMTLYNLGESKAAVALLLGLACDVSTDGLGGYARAIRFYADDLDRRWG